MSLNHFFWKCFAFSFFPVKLNHNIWFSGLKVLNKLTVFLLYIGLVLYIISNNHKNQVDDRYEILIVLNVCLFAENLYDVFLNIRDDEAEHCKTMKACQTHGSLRSPHSHSEDASISMDEQVCTLPEYDCEGIADCIKKSLTDPKWRYREHLEEK